MKIYLDDVRTPPSGWILTKTANGAIEYLKTDQVKQISLDHDLGDDESGTGYDVLLWIEQQVAVTDFDPPIIFIHTSNTSAEFRMKQARRSIGNLLIQRKIKLTKDDLTKIF